MTIDEESKQNKQKEREFVVLHEDMSIVYINNISDDFFDYVMYKNFDEKTLLPDVLIRQNILSIYEHLTRFLDLVYDSLNTKKDLFVYNERI